MPTPADKIYPDLRVLPREWDAYLETAKIASQNGVIPDNSVAQLLDLAIERFLPEPSPNPLQNDLADDALRPSHPEIAELYPNEAFRRAVVPILRRHWRRMRTFGLMTGRSADCILLTLLAALLRDLRANQTSAVYPAVPVPLSSFKAAVSERYAKPKIPQDRGPVVQAEAGGVDDDWDHVDMVQWNFSLPTATWPGDLRPIEQNRDFLDLLDEALPPYEAFGRGDIPVDTTALIETAVRIAACPYPLNCERSRKRTRVPYHFRQRIDGAAAAFEMTRHDFLFAVVSGSVALKQRQRLAGEDPVNAGMSEFASRTGQSDGDIGDGS